jgi:hypothetical protein
MTIMPRKGNPNPSPGTRFAPGTSGNPGGARKLPDEFKLKGPKFLEEMAKIAEDPKHRDHYRALEWCCERLYDKARMAVDLGASDDSLRVIQEMLARIPRT